MVAVPRLARTCVPLLLLIAAPACDKLPFGGDDESSDKDGDKTQEEIDAEIEAAKKAAVEEHKKKAEAEVEARIAAEAQKAVEDYKKKTEADAKQVEVPEDDDKPMILSDLRITNTGGMFGPASGMLEIKADAKIKEQIGSNTYVHVKAFCEDDGHVFTDIGYLNADYSKPLENYSVDEEAEVRGNLFGQGFDHQMSPCSLQFKLAGMGGGGLAVDLGEGCWDGKEAKIGACEKPVVAVAASGGGKTVELLDVIPQPSSYGSRGLNLNYQLLFHDKHDPADRLTFKATCHDGGKGFVDVGQAYVMTGPFKLEAGEAIARSASLFWNNAFPFASPPTLCDLTVSRWTTKPGSYGTYDEEVLYEGCLRDVKVDKGRCDGSVVTRKSPVAMTETNATLDEVSLSLIEPYGATGKFQLDIKADVTPSETLAYDQGVNAQVTCKVGTEKRVETAYLYGMDLYYLLPGETTRMTSSAFSSHAMDKPKWCQVDFTGGARYAMGGAGIDMGKYCLKRDKVKKGKC